MAISVFHLDSSDKLCVREISDYIFGTSICYSASNPGNGCCVPGTRSTASVVEAVKLQTFTFDRKDDVLNT